MAVITHNGHLHMMGNTKCCKIPGRRERFPDARTFKSVPAGNYVLLRARFRLHMSSRKRRASLNGAAVYEGVKRVFTVNYDEPDAARGRQKEREGYVWSKAGPGRRGTNMCGAEEGKEGGRRGYVWRNGGTGEGGLCVVERKGRGAEGRLCEGKEGGQKGIRERPRSVETRGSQGGRG